MTQIAKLLEKIRRNTRNVSLEEFESVARHFGEIEQGGKHPRIVIGKADIALQIGKSYKILLCM